MRRSVPVLAAILAVAGASTLISSNRPTQTVVSHVHPSYAEAYDNVVDATKASEIVVVARGLGRAVSASDKLTPDTVSTLFSFRVIRAIKGNLPVGSPITIKQAGGTTGVLETRVDGDPLMDAGGTYLLFLERADGGPYDGDYFAIGGPSGRLEVDSAGVLHPEGEGILRPTPGTTLDAILSGEVAN